MYLTSLISYQYYIIVKYIHFVIICCTYIYHWTSQYYLSEWIYRQGKHDIWNKNNFWIDRYWKNEYHLRRLDSRSQIHADKKYNERHASHMPAIAFLHGLSLYGRDINEVWNKNNFWISIYWKKNIICGVSTSDPSR